jgi:hypothetical protein
MIKLRDILFESTHFNNWVIPSDSDLEREFRVEHEMKGLNYFDSSSDFIQAIKNSEIVSVTPSMDRRISRRSRTNSFEELLTLIKGYRSYPKYRNEKTLRAIYDGFKDGEPMDMPIVIKGEDNHMTIFSGNTRMDIAFQLGIHPKVVMVQI